MRVPKSRIAEETIAALGRSFSWSPGMLTEFGRWAFRFKPEVVFPCPVAVPDSRLTMELDHRHWQDRMMAYGYFEQSLLRYMRETLRPGDHFVDVGANIGFFTLHAAQIVGAAGRVDAIEPMAETAARLKKNVSLNGLERIVRIHNVAAGKVAGTLELTQYGAATGLSSVYDRGEHLGARQRFTVLQVRLDELLASCRPAFIKIDVEGYEPEVLEGATGLWAAMDQPPTLALEYAEGFAPYTALHPRRVLQLLRDGQPRYECYHLEGGMRRLDLRDPREPNFEFGTLIVRPA